MRFLFSSLLFSALLAPAQVTLDYYLPTGVTYNANIPTPQDLLGYEVGKWHVSHDQLTYYMQVMAAASDRMVLEEYGRSYENRPLVTIYVTSKSNHARLEEIKANRQKIKAGQNVAGPLVVWLGYSVHGNEASGANASLLTAYYLAAAQGPAIDEILENMVIILDPSYNPDGLNRFASWVNTHRSTKSPNADPNDREHNEVWPGGRTNHYWFDLNRDWLPVQHPESQGRIRRFHEWVPNILTDHHEMGTNQTFFFQPGIPSRTNPLTPAKNQSLTNDIAKYHAAFLDSIGSLYYSRESFDDYYVGKGSSYPDILGCIGILFEQASSRGHVQKSPYGDVSFPFAIRNHFVSSLSTLRAAHRLKNELQLFQSNFFQNASQGLGVGGYVFGDALDLKKSRELARILLNHDIDVYDMKGSIRSGGENFGTGSFVIPTAQPEARLIEAIFEKRTTFQDSLFYDVSSWTLPLAMNLPFGEVSTRDIGELLGDPASESDVLEGQSLGVVDAYAYLIKPHGYFVHRALNRLLAQGILVNVLHESHQSGDSSFPTGTLSIPVGIQPEKRDLIEQTLTQIRVVDGLDVFGLETGLAVSGIDLGSPSQDKVELLRVAVLVGEGVNGYEAGEVWHLLDHRMETPVTLLPLEDFNETNLNAYNRLIFPNGNYSRINEQGQENLKRWIEDGGVIVAWKDGGKWLADAKLANVKYKEKTDKKTESRNYADYNKYRGAQVTGGTIFRASLDTSHPLLYGITRSEMALFRNHNTVMEASENAYAHPLRYTSEPLWSGYVSKENAERIANSPAVTISSKGQGRMIVLADNPNFRAFWYGTNKLFLNALYFGHTISSGTTTR